MEGGDNMCKYCDIGNSTTSGRTTNTNDIMEIQEGKISFVVGIYRDASVTDTNDHSGELYISFDADKTAISAESIPIKYCPFCGEEL